MSEVRCPDEAASEAMMDAIDRAKEAGDTLGGTFRVVVTGLLPTLGGYETPTDRLTSKLGGALFSIPAIKGVEFGLGFEATRRPGSRVHDEILLDEKRGFVRASNNAGGLEGGMTTGMPLVVTVGMKPIATLTTPLETVNLDTLEVAKASKERSDTCAFPCCCGGRRIGSRPRHRRCVPAQIRIRQHDPYQAEHRFVQGAHQDHVALSDSKGRECHSCPALNVPKASTP